MKQYKAILFDLDGTLLDTSEGVISSVQYTIDTLGYEKLDVGQMRSFIGPPVHRRLREIYGISEEESLRAMNIFRSHYGGDDLLKAHAYEGMKDLLLYLHEKAISLALQPTSVRTWQNVYWSIAALLPVLIRSTVRMPPENTPKQMLSATASTHWV